MTMRLANVAAAVLLCGPSLAPAAGDDEAAVRAQFGKFSEAWVKGDARAVAAGYAEDADIVRPNQPKVAGRASIQAFYEQMFAGPLAGVAKAMQLEAVRFITPEVAVVDASYTLDRDAPALHAKGSSVVVLAKRQGRWVTVVSRSYRLP
jgi:uncharacterized protein (TIGR02246 family)